MTTASTLVQLFGLITADYWFEEVLHKYLSNRNERDEYRQELHLSICTMGDKAINYWNQGVFRWIYIGIINNNLKSKTSPWHYKFRKRNYDLYDDIEGFQVEEKYLDDEDENEKYREDIEKIKKIHKIITNKIKESPSLVREFDLFKMYYVSDMNYRQISKKTNICLKSVHNYVKKAKNIIQEELNKNK